MTIAVVVIAVVTLFVEAGAPAPAVAAAAVQRRATSSVLTSGALWAATGGPSSQLLGQGPVRWAGTETVKHVGTGVVLQIRPAADVPVRRCEFGFQVSGQYDKPDFTAVMREEGLATGVSTCGPDLVSVMTVDATIDDFGMPGVGGHQVATGTNQGSGPGPVVATVAQNVMLVEAPPPDNYRIEWTFHLRATSVDGQQATACAKLQAVFPGNVTPASC